MSSREPLLLLPGLIRELVALARSNGMRSVVGPAG